METCAKAVDGSEKCGKPLDTEGSPRWCKACRAQYQREYKDIVKEMTESRGFAAGMSAMRDYLAHNFDTLYGTQGSFTGAQIAHLIRTVRGPAVG